MFSKRFELSLNRVHDTLRIVEGDERLELKVDADPMRMVAGLNEAQKMLRMLNAESTKEQQHDAAMFFAAVIFGEAQAAKIFEFYRDDPTCVINICGKYFAARLAKKIDKAQRKAK